MGIDLKYPIQPDITASPNAFRVTLPNVNSVVVKDDNPDSSFRAAMKTVAFIRENGTVTRAEIAAFPNMRLFSLSKKQIIEKKGTILYNLSVVQMHRDKCTVIDYDT